MWKLSAHPAPGGGCHAVGAVASIRSGTAADAGRDPRAGVGHRARRHRPAGRGGDGRGGTGALRGAVRAVSRTRRAKETWARDWWADKGRSRTPRPLKTVGSFWPYATTLWDYVNRAMPFDRPGLLAAAGGVRGGGLRAEPERHHRGGPGDGRDEPPEGEDAEPRWVRRRSPAGCPIGTPPPMNRRVVGLNAGSE